MSKEKTAIQVETKSNPRSGANIRMVKMAQPICKECQFPHRFGWWNDCPHDPYWTEEMVETSEPQMEEQEDGTFLITGEKKRLIKKRTPNLTQVALTERHNSGQGVVLSQRNKGFKFLQEINLEPMCQFRDCWRSVQGDKKVRTDWGDFCSSQHARLVGADELGVVLEIPGNQYYPRIRDEQLRKIDLTPSR